MRIKHEAKYYKDKNFVTLTYRDENLPENNSLKPKDLQDYFKRLRKAGLKFKYYAAGEYGEKYGRPHYHVLFLGIPIKAPEIAGKWPHGAVYEGTVTHQSIDYVTSYIQKKIFGDMAEEHYNGRLPEFNRVSKGMGKTFLNEYLKEILEQLEITEGNYKSKIPRYYHKKIVELQNSESWTYLTEKYKKASEAEKTILLDVCYLDGNLKDLTPYGLDDYIQTMLRANGRRYDEHLKAQGKINTLKKLKRRRTQ